MSSIKSNGSAVAGVVSVLFTRDRRIFFGHGDGSIRVAEGWERDEVLLQMLAWRDRFSVSAEPLPEQG